LPFATEGINEHIEQAILTADKIGVKVISLAALNKVRYLVWHNELKFGVNCIFSIWKCIDWSLEPRATKMSSKFSLRILTLLHAQNRD
jgi:hypothetical protein